MLGFLVQSPDESSYSFLIRCIETRQKLLLASEKSREIKYEEHFVRQLFFKTIENGLTNRHVLQEIKPMLRNQEPDETLISEITRISSAEKERMSVQSKARSKAARVHQNSRGFIRTRPRKQTKTSTYNTRKSLDRFD